MARSASTMGPTRRHSCRPSAPVQAASSTRFAGADIKAESRASVSGSVRQRRRRASSVSMRSKWSAIHFRRTAGSAAIGPSEPNAALWASVIHGLPATAPSVPRSRNTASSMARWRSIQARTPSASVLRHMAAVRAASPGRRRIASEASLEPAGMALTAAHTSSSSSAGGLAEPRPRTSRISKFRTWTSMSSSVASKPGANSPPSGRPAGRRLIVRPGRAWRPCPAWRPRRRPWSSRTPRWCSGRRRRPSHRPARRTRRARRGRRSGG